MDAASVGNIVNQGIFPGMMGGGQGQLALNQLLVTMDGIDNPPFMRRFCTNRINTLLDAIYIVPRRVGRISLRLPTPRPLGAQIYFIGATNVPIERPRPGADAPGAHGPPRLVPDADEGRPQGHLRSLPRHASRTTPTSTRRQRRDEIARITNGYSPAMIEQICSMALTNAHHEGQTAFSWQHLVDAMTAIESGTAIGVRYVEQRDARGRDPRGGPRDRRPRLPARASSRAGSRSACAAARSATTRSFEKEERFSSGRARRRAISIHTLGAMAAEHVFYGENSSGVGGDLG